MDLNDRIGFDGGTDELESMIDYAITNNFYFIDFNADKGLNHLDSWDKGRISKIRDLCDKNGISIGLHTLSAVNIAEELIISSSDTCPVRSLPTLSCATRSALTSNPITLKCRAKATNRGSPT